MRTGTYKRSKGASACKPESFADILGAVDWDFSDRTAGSNLENIHPYPAKFIPDIPAALLKIIPRPKNTIVLDPFVGSGTTMVECQRRGISSIGVDLNPIACLIARVKTAPLPQNLDAVLDAVIRRSLRKSARVPSIPNLDHWFTPGIQGVVASLAAAIADAPIVCHDILRLGLSSILVRVSNQESDTRYAAIEKQIDPLAVTTFFQTAVRRILVALSKRDYELPPATVIEHDTLAIDPNVIGRRVGAIITSPPYPNAYEYWLYHKYRMYWLGFDPVAVKAKEIGARAHFFKTNHHTADTFVEQMQRTFALIDKVLVVGGYVAFVVGRSRIHGETIDNANIIETVASEYAFSRAFKAERTIAATRKSFNLSHANIKTETLLVMTR
jgi:site-specific DNA-methyltransferase (cytosine-N4-specific)